MAEEEVDSELVQQLRKILALGRDAATREPESPPLTIIAGQGREDKECTFAVDPRVLAAIAKLPGAKVKKDGGQGPGVT